MIVVKLRGGLGNQLFQYALGRAKSEQLQDKLYLDLDDFQVNNERNYELHSYSINADICNSSLVDKIYKDNTILHKLFGLNSWKIIREKNTEFDPQIVGLSGNLYLDGYWNSYKYFANYRDSILNDLVLSTKLEIESEVISKQIMSTNSVSIHVRRGDYANNSLTKAKHGLLNEKYYKDAVTYLINKFKALKFYIFSDDVEWVTRNMQFVPNREVIYQSSAVEDLYKQNLCKHHIIANSTYSWWGAWMSNNNGITIAPSKWSNDPKLKIDDIFPPDWIAL